MPEEGVDEPLVHAYSPVFVNEQVPLSKSQPGSDESVGRVVGDELVGWLVGCVGSAEGRNVGSEYTISSAIMDVVSTKSTVMSVELESEKIS